MNKKFFELGNMYYSLRGNKMFFRKKSVDPLTMAAKKEGFEIGTVVEMTQDPGSLGVIADFNGDANLLSADVDWVKGSLVVPGLEAQRFRSPVSCLKSRQDK
jgi:hypothetical protein